MKHKTMSMVLTALLLTAAAWLLTPAQAVWAGCGDTNPRTVLCVDADASPTTPNGLSWTDAFTNVQDALTVTNIYSTTNYEIWVAEGVYYPDEGAGTIADSPTMSFTLRYNNVQLYGGFAGYGISETLRTQRDWDAHPTILSGDLQQDDTTVNGVVTYTGAISGANAYHVLYLDGTTTPITGTTVIDGFVITAGKADGTSSPADYGGGLYCMRASPTLTNITFSGNYAEWGGGMLNDYSDPTLTNVTFSGNQALGGGGMYNYESNPTLTHVTFSDNRAEYSGSGGGGMYNDHSNPTLTHVTFSDNRAEYSGGGGGGMFNEYSSLTLTNVTLWGNRANYGGGMYNYTTTLTLTNVTLSGNWADDDGGGMCNDFSDPTLTNVTLSGNYADLGGGMYNFDSDPTLTNVILWGNTASSNGNELYNDNAAPVLSYTLIATATGDIYNDTSTVTYGDGMLYTDPQFVAPITATAAPTTTGNYRLRAGSPAIDAGDNAAITVTTDLDGNPRIYNGVVDMGAYEAHPALVLGKSVTPTTNVAYHSLVTYTVVLSNSGFADDPQVLFTDTLTTSPVAFASWVISPAHTLLSNGEITWSGTVTTGEAITWTWAVTHTGDYAETVTNTARFSGTLQTGQAQAGFSVEPNYAPVLSVIGDRPVDELTELAFTATVTDANVNDTLTFTLDAGSVGSITTNGNYTWTPTEAQGPGTYTATVRVTDGELDDAETLTITVADVNTAPALAAIGDKTVDELTELAFTATATDTDLPTQPLTYTLDAGSAGNITTGGDYTWTPTEADGPGTYTATVRVTDGELDDAETFTITVNEVNAAPVLDAIGAKTVDELSELTFTATATDADLPAQPLTYTLDAGSAGSITPGGDYTWTPTEAVGPGVYTATVRVTDGELDDADTLTITVAEVNTAPVLDAIGDKTVDELTELAFTATATDADLPAQPLTFTLDSGSVGSITTGGAYTWTPTEAQGPGTYTATVRVTDGELDDADTITITVNEVNTAPALAAVGDKTVDELSELTFTATATDTDLPTQTLTYTLDTGSVGNITAGGAFTWTPTEAQGPGTYTATVRVSDGAREDAETFTITVNEVNVAPALDAIGDKTVDELTELAFTATATDADLPAQPLTFTLDAGSVGSITTNGNYTWTPTEADGPGVYTATARVTDGELDDADTITITVVEVNVAPTADAGADQFATQGDVVTLDGSGSSDPDTGDSLTYGWMQTGGPPVALNDGAAVSPTFTASVTGTLTFQLTVTDTAPFGNGGGLSDSDTTVVTVTAPDVPTHTLTIYIEGQGDVTRSPAGTAIVPLQSSYISGTEVTLTPQPTAGWHFTSWSGDLSGAANPAQVTMDADKVITATFSQTPPPTYTLDVRTEGSGSVAVDPDQTSYISGTEVTLTATADPGWYFTSWSGDLSGAANPAQVMMDADKVITATFSQTPPPTYTLDVRIEGNGSVDIDPDQTSYISGTEVTLTPQPAAGWQFTGWSGDLSGVANPAQVTLDADKVITATFIDSSYWVYLPLVSRE